MKILRSIIAALSLLLVSACAASGQTAGNIQDRPVSVDDPATITRRDVLIDAGDIVLAATLYRPITASGDMPAVVIVHGSGRTSREAAGFWTNVALRAGLTALVFDKRGVGSSTGAYREWTIATTPTLFDELATDVEWAVRWLATEPGIDAGRIGLMGASQAGWVMPLAASREPLIRYLVIGEGVPLPAGLEEIHSTYLDSVAVYGEQRPSLRQVNAADALAEDYIGERGFDPGPILEASTIPMLWTYGLYDEAIPTHLSIDRIGVLQKTGKTNLDIHIFPFGDHNFYNVFTGARYDLSAVSKNWLETIGILRTIPSE